MDDWYTDLPDGQEASYTTLVAEGYQFVGWCGNEVLVARDNTYYTIRTDGTVEGNHNVA